MDISGGLFLPLPPLPYLPHLSGATPATLSAIAAHCPRISFKSLPAFAFSG
jgi:hypothetical protein